MEYLHCAFPNCKGGTRNLHLAHSVQKGGTRKKPRWFCYQTSTNRKVVQIFKGVITG